jgi:hypothetical protein
MKYLTINPNERVIVAFAIHRLKCHPSKVPELPAQPRPAVKVSVESTSRARQKSPTQRLWPLERVLSRVHLGARLVPPQLRDLVFVYVVLDMVVVDPVHAAVRRDSESWRKSGQALMPAAVPEKARNTGRNFLSKDCWSVHSISRWTGAYKTMPCGINPVVCFNTHHIMMPDSLSRGPCFCRHPLSASPKLQPFSRTQSLVSKPNAMKLIDLQATLPRSLNNSMAKAP